MRDRTVKWATLREGVGAAPADEGRRERKKRLMRQQLSDTATEMFMERGFDAVRVSEIADVCDVAEKTVFNYFPTKESLVLDRWESTIVSLRTGLAAGADAPVEAVQGVLLSELDDLLGWVARQEDPELARSQVRRFGALVQSTPSLRAHQRDALDRIAAGAAEVLAEQAGVSPDAPEPQIAAIALLGLWNVQTRAIARSLNSERPLDEIRAIVAGDVQRAARLIEHGLGSLVATTSESRGRTNPAVGGLAGSARDE